MNGGYPMTAGSYGARRERSHTESDAGDGLAMVMGGAGASGLLALVTLFSGGGLLAAFLVYVLGASAVVPVIAVAPYARRALATVRRRDDGPRFSRQPS
jgi:hypothetical protein